MNCPSRTDETASHPDWNQSPPRLAADTTTVADLTGMANVRQRPDDPTHRHEAVDDHAREKAQFPARRGEAPLDRSKPHSPVQGQAAASTWLPNRFTKGVGRTVERTRRVASRYVRFVGPGMLIAVAYIDPGNYATDVGA